MQGVRIIGVPLDLGQERRGVDMGPSAVRGAGLRFTLESLGIAVEDTGDMPVKIAETQPFGDQKVKYMTEIEEGCRRLAADVKSAADWVTDRHDEDGLVSVVDWILG